MAASGLSRARRVSSLPQTCVSFRSAALSLLTSIRLQLLGGGSTVCAYVEYVTSPQQGLDSANWIKTQAADRSRSTIKGKVYACTAATVSVLLSAVNTTRCAGLSDVLRGSTDGRVQDSGAYLGASWFKARALFVPSCVNTLKDIELE